MDMLILSSIQASLSLDYLSQQVQAAGFILLDPARYKPQSNQSNKNVQGKLHPMILAKQCCLQDALSASAQGIPVAMFDACLSQFDILTLQNAGCSLHYIPADICAQEFFKTLTQLRDKPNRREFKGTGYEGGTSALRQVG